MKHSMIGCLAVLALAACGADAPQMPEGEVTELTIVDEQVGNGATAVSGSVAVVHYTGWLYDAEAADRRGEEFDTSRDRGQPFEFPLGAQRVIRGWDEGVAGMRVGGKRVLYLPPDYAYGARGVGTIPPNSTLVFEVELLDVRGAPEDR